MPKMLIDEVKELLKREPLTTSDIDKLSELSFILFDQQGYRPIFPDKVVNKLIGRIHENSGRESIDHNFFKQTERVKYLIKFTEIQPLLKVLEDPRFQLPLCRTNDLSPYLEELFNNYKTALKSIPTINLLTDQEHRAIDTLCNSVLNAVDKYFDGYPSLAYQSLEQGMTIVTNYIREFYNEQMNQYRFFRMRLGNNHKFSRNEMFHIPFQLRGIVRTQRYSIPGLPCLYLGSSAYVCWEEMKMPDLNLVQTSLFARKPEREFKLLDISLPPKTVAQLTLEALCKDYGTDKWESLVDAFRGYLVIWPLIASCSIKVLHPEDSFKPEYIIPQLLLQWIRLSPRYDGICYFSVAARSIMPSNYHLFKNYALPVKMKKSKGFCDHLKELFWVTEAVPWQAFQIYKNTGIGLDTYDYHAVEFEPLYQSKINYSRTDFAKIESFLIQNGRPKSIIE